MATCLQPMPHDISNLKYVGFNNDIDCKNANCYEQFYSQDTVNYISKTITNYLMPMRGLPIIVPDQQIRELITSVVEVEGGANRPGIYTKDTFDLPWAQDSFKRI